MTAHGMPDELDPRTLTDDDHVYYVLRYVHDRYARGRYNVGRIHGPYRMPEARQALEHSSYSWVHGIRAGSTAEGAMFRGHDAYVCHTAEDEDEYPTLLLVISSGVPPWYLVSKALRKIRTDGPTPEPREDMDI